MKPDTLSSAGGLTRLHRALALVCSILLLPLIVAATEATRTFDVPAGEAEVTLKQFATQAQREIVFAPGQVAGLRTNPVQGELAPREALDLMLADTGLTVAQDARTGAFAVRRDPAPNGARAVATTSQRPEGSSTHLAEDGVVRLHEFEIFASKLVNADIPRTRDDVQPYIVFDRLELEQSGATDLNEFFRTRLPANNVGSSSPLQNTTARNYSSISLRGLGPNQTLILLDGRRLPTLPTGFAGNSDGQADVNGIPINMIERIEILPSTAAGIYGGGATGGVINIITRKDYSGIEVTLSYANTFDTDAYRRRASINGSLSVNQGKTFLTFSSSMSDGSMLKVGDRDFARKGRALLLANRPAAFYSPTVTPPIGYTPNIRSQNGSNLVLKSGTALNSPFTHVPVGYAGPASDGGAALVSTAGAYTFKLAETTVNGAQAGLSSTPSLKTASLGARQQLGSNVELFIDATSSRNTGRFASAGASSTSVTLPVSAPNNPFTVPIVVAFAPTQLSATQTYQTHLDRVTSGVVVRLPREWRAGGDFAWSKSRTIFENFGNLVGDPDGSGPLPSYASALAAGTLNIMRDLNVFPLDYTPYLMPRPKTLTDYSNRAKQGTARASGPLWQLPAGPLNLAFTIDWLRQEQPSVVVEGVSAVPSTFSWYPSVSTELSSGYFEVQVPVLSEQRQSILRALEVQASLRYDDFQSVGPRTLTVIRLPDPNSPPPADYDYLTRKLHAYSGMMGFKYSPIPDVALRLSSGTGFLAPSISQLSTAPSATTAGFSAVDPKRQAVLAPLGSIIVNQGGNPNLNPEYSTSLSGGIIYKPNFLRGLRISADVTQIEKRDEIVSLSLQASLDYEDQFPGRVVRAPLTAADQALGYTGGRVLEVSTRTENIARKRIMAYDFQVEFAHTVGSLGRLRAYAAATYQSQLSTQVRPDLPFTNAIGFISGLRWRGNAGLDWSLGPWSAGWNAQYYDSYIGYSSVAGPSTIAIVVGNQGTDTIPRQVYHDVYAGYDFGTRVDGWRRYLANTRLSVGVQNVFNTSPPTLATTAPQGGFSGYGDPRLARYTITLRKRL